MAGTATNGLDLSGLKIKDLKTVIEAGALEHKDCLDRADLERRAAEAVAQTCTFVATLDLRRLEVAAKVWDARRKQDSDYESDCSDESGPPGLDTGLDDDDDGPPGLEGDDDGPPGLEKDGAVPPGGSAGSGSDSDYDSDGSDDSGPPGLEDEEERERAERAARKKAAAAPAPAPAPPLSKSQAKAAKAKRQKVRARRPVSNLRLAVMAWVCTPSISLPTQMRKQAAFADTLKKGSKVFVTKKGVASCVEINQ